jgi:hypothetical protein
VAQWSAMADITMMATALVAAGKTVEVLETGASFREQRHRAGFARRPSRPGETESLAPSTGAVTACRWEWVAVLLVRGARVRTGGPPSKLGRASQLRGRERGHVTLRQTEQPTPTSHTRMCVMRWGYQDFEPAPSRQPFGS